MSHIETPGHHGSARSGDQLPGEFVGKILLNKKKFVHSMVQIRFVVSKPHGLVHGPYTGIIPRSLVDSLAPYVLESPLILFSTTNVIP